MYSPVWSKIVTQRFNKLVCNSLGLKNNQETEKEAKTIQSLKLLRPRSTIKGKIRVVSPLILNQFQASTTNSSHVRVINLALVYSPYTLKLINYLATENGKSPSGGLHKTPKLIKSQFGGAMKPDAQTLDASRNNNSLQEDYKTDNDKPQSSNTNN